MANLILEKNSKAKAPTKFVRWRGPPISHNLDVHLDNITDILVNISGLQINLKKCQWLLA